MSKLKSEGLEFYYYHRNNPLLLQDIPGLKHETNEIVPSHLSGHVKSGDFMFINTWYGCDNHKYMNRYGLTFDCLFASFSDACKLGFGFGLEQSDYLEYFPSIDFDRYEISKAREFVKKAEESSNKLVLVANGPVHSGQSANFNLSTVVADLAKKYQGLVFLLTDKSNEELVHGHNIFYTSDVIGKSGNDLNENAWLGSQSDFIVGRASGVFSFCVTKEIVFNNPNTSFISFSDLDLNESGFWLGEIFRNKVSYKSKMCNYKFRSSSEAMNLLDRTFHERYGRK